MTQTLEQLSAAATQSDAMSYAKSIVEAVERGCTFEDKCIAVRDWLIAYRTGQLVALADDAVERVARAIQGSYNASDPSEILSWSAISEHERNLYRRDAKAAIAAMKDTQPALAAKGTGDE